jgi:hypothetical protein
LLIEQNYLIFVVLSSITNALTVQIPGSDSKRRGEEGKTRAPAACFKYESIGEYPGPQPPASNMRVLVRIQGPSRLLLI